MNEKFFALPDEKRNRIINAGLKCFALAGYRHAVTSEIAAEADISKGLLFHYFGNKKGLYHWLFQYSIQYMRDQLVQKNIFQKTDFFELMKRAAWDKADIVRERPYIYQFISRTYYDGDPDLVDMVNGFYGGIGKDSVQAILERTDRSRFRDGVDLSIVIQMVIWCGEGFMLQRQRQGIMDDLEETCAQFDRVMDELRRAFYKEEFHEYHRS